MQRTGQPPKTGFLFRLPHPIAKITQKIAPTGYAPEGKDDGIEILCEGQQVVAFGIHPDTQKPYQWHGFDPTDFMGKVDDLPEITRERIVEFLEWVCDAYGPQKLLSVKAAAAIQPPAAHTVTRDPEEQLAILSQRDKRDMQGHLAKCPDAEAGNSGTSGTCA